MNKTSKMSAFEMNLIEIMAHLYKNNAIDDKIMDTISGLSFDYHTLLHQSKVLEEKANIDTKTNLIKYNEDYLSMILKSASRIMGEVGDRKYYLTLIRFDLDNFSTINTKYGHNNGDIILMKFAELLLKSCRPTDHVIRFGGEEFDIILPATDREGAHKFLHNVYKKIHKDMLFYFNDEQITITASAGVSILGLQAFGLKFLSSSDIKEEYLKLQKNADDALYDAKVSGKNRFKFFSSRKKYNEMRDKYLNVRGIEERAIS